MEEREVNHDGKNTALEVLAPSLAERLAIHGHGCGKDDNNDGEEQEEKNGNDDKGDVPTIGGTYRPLSPSPSDDSSIKTAFSISGGTGTIVTNAVITGGSVHKHSLVLLPPSSFTQQQQHTHTFHHCMKQHSSSNKTTLSMHQMKMYPCASTASGVSSENDGVDEDDDNDVYYTSHGNTMWQIDGGIKESLSYTFDICPLPASPTCAVVPFVAMSFSSTASNSNREE
eukprot:7697603-Ditylum_brightwellii.AAC.1